MPRALRCTEVHRRIDDHVDGLLPAQEAESVRDHLDSCRDCRETAFAAKAASTSLAVWGDLEPPTDCFDRILTRISTLPAHALERAPRIRSARRGWVRMARIALPVAAAASLVGAFLVTEPDTRSRVPRIPNAQITGPYAGVGMRLGPVYDSRDAESDDDDDVLLLQEMDDGLRRSQRSPQGRGLEIWTPR